MQIKAGTLKGLLRLVPRDIAKAGYRPALYGPTFEPNGIVMATNGQMLLAFRSGREFEGDGFVISADVLRAAIKGKKAREEVEIVAPAERLAPPAWQHNVPDAYTGEHDNCNLDPELLLTLRDAINEIQETEELARPCDSIKVLQPIPNGRGAWLAYATDRLLAIIMPLNLDLNSDKKRRICRCATEFLTGPAT
jgi:hypothetical protein